MYNPLRRDIIHNNVTHKAVPCFIAYDVLVHLRRFVSVFFAPGMGT